MSKYVDTAYEFLKQVNSDQLKREVDTFCAQMNAEEDGDLALLRIDTVEETIAIWFNQALSTNAEVQLDDIITNYVFVADYISPEDQAQIDKLVGYLNNANPAIANAARAIIVLNLAPRLGAELITLINTQIAAKIGS